MPAPAANSSFHLHTPVFGKGQGFMLNPIPTEVFDERRDQNLCGLFGQLQ